MKVTMIVGVPCVGKSLLVRELMKLDGPWGYEPIKYIPKHVSVLTGTTILGRYDEPHQFPGTDRMSMGAQPHVLRWLHAAAKLETRAVIFEGDRLGNASMAKALHEDPNIDFEMVHMWPRPEVIRRRRASERSQSDTFVRSRETKIGNLTGFAAFNGVSVYSHESTTLADIHDIVAHIRKNRT